MFGHYIKVSCLLLWKCNATLLLTGKCIDRLKNLFVYLGKKAQIPKKMLRVRVLLKDTSASLTPRL